MKVVLATVVGLGIGFALFFGANRIESIADHHTSAHAQASPSPAPTPVDQHWRVEYGDVEMLEEKLRTLNAAGRFVTYSDIRVSNDGKRFVVIIADDAETEDY